MCLVDCYFGGDIHCRSGSSSLRGCCRLEAGFGLMRFFLMFIRCFTRLRFIFMTVICLCITTRMRLLWHLLAKYTSTTCSGLFVCIKSIKSRNI